MSVRRRDVLAAAALAAGGRSRAQPTTFEAGELRAAQQLADAALRDTHAARLLTELCTQIGARPAGSAADAKAAAWALAAMKDLGLARVRAEPLALRVWQRGTASARVLTPEMLSLTMAALGNSVATPAEGITAEVAWYDSLVELQADTREPGRSRAHGRIVFINQKTDRTRDGRGYGAAVPARAFGPVEAARRGALALGIRSIGTDRERIAHTGALRYEIGAPRIPAFAVSVPDAEAPGCLARARPAAAAGIEARREASDVEATTHNVIGEVPGTDLAHETVTHRRPPGQLGPGPGRGGRRRRRGHRHRRRGAASPAWPRGPRRTVRVVLFGNEENGFDGARPTATATARTRTSGWVKATSAPAASGACAAACGRRCAAAGAADGAGAGAAGRGLD
jgi:carboxypeptidase Q